jgi:hypothetical protein
MTSPPIFLATSLVPGRDHALQAATVASWLACGFEVISVNGAAEADAVSKAYPDVVMIPVSATAERFAKKPVPYIHDMLKVLRQAITARGLALDTCVAGIINADIYMRNVAGLKEFIQREAQGSLLCGPRVDVADLQSFASFTPTGAETYSIGYDYFFMSGAALEDFADSPFCMGMPFWDYWMPLVTLLKGMPLKTFTSPVALHVHHDTRWDDTIYLFFHALITYVIELARRTRGQNPSAAGRQFDLFFDFVSHLYGAVFTRGTEPAKDGTTPDAAGVAMLADFYDRFQQVAVHHIKAQAAPVTLAEALNRS